VAHLTPGKGRVTVFSEGGGKGGHGDRTFLAFFEGGKEKTVDFLLVAGPKRNRKKRRPEGRPTTVHSGGKRKKSVSCAVVRRSLRGTAKVGGERIQGIIPSLPRKKRKGRGGEVADSNRSGEPPSTTT